MRLSTIVVLSVTGAAILAGGGLSRSARPLVATVTREKKGIKSLQCNNVEYIGDGEFRVERVTLKKANGETYLGQTSGSVDLDVQKQAVFFVNDRIQMVEVVERLRDLERIFGHVRRLSRHDGALHCRIRFRGGQQHLPEVFARKLPAQRGGR